MRFKPNPISNKRVPVTRSRVPGFLDFGRDNLFPQTLLDVIDDSDTASAAMSIRAEFIEGNGFKFIEVAEKIINSKGQTLDDLLAETAQNVALGEVVSLHVTYNGLGKIVEVQAVPWQTVRFQEPDDLGNITHAGIFPYLGSLLYPKKKEEHSLVSLFNPRPEVIAAQIAGVGDIELWNGQLLHRPTGPSGHEIYHKPSYAGGSVAFETEKELATFDYRTTTADFSVAGMIKGLEPTARMNPETGLMEMPDSLADKVRPHQGADNAGSMMVITADTVEELDAIEFLPITGADIANRYNAMTQRVIERIARRIRVPGELMAFKQNGISFT